MANHRGGTRNQQTQEPQVGSANTSNSTPDTAHWIDGEYIRMRNQRRHLSGSTGSASSGSGYRTIHFPPAPGGRQGSK